MLPRPYVAGSDRMRVSASEPSSEGISDCRGNATHAQDQKKLNVNVKLHDLDPQALHGLHELVSLVHEGLNAGDQQECCTSPSDSGITTNGNCEKKITTNSNILEEANEQDPCTSTSDRVVTPKKTAKNTMVNQVCCLEDDSIAKVIWQFEPLALQSVFLAMVHNFPRTLEALILHLLSPVGAEVVARKFDEMDQLMTDEERSSFYETFYSVFDDQFAAMDAILNVKESFAHQAFKNVLQQYVGVNVDSNEDLSISCRGLI